MILLLDIGNTHTHLGLANEQAVLRCAAFPTSAWAEGGALRRVHAFVGHSRPEGIAVASVVPRATALARRALRAIWAVRWFELTARTVRPALGIRYPKAKTIGADRLANALAAKHHYGAPCLAVDLGTAVTFDVVNRGGDFIGGVIAPGRSLMTDYLHEKTALLPAIRPGSPRRAIGRSTAQAISIAAAHGFRGMVQELIRHVKHDLGCRRLPVVATGGDGRWAARTMPEITAFEPRLTLEGLRLAFLAT